MVVIFFFKQLFSELNLGIYVQHQKAYSLFQVKANISSLKQKTHEESVKGKKREGASSIFGGEA